MALPTSLTFDEVYDAHAAFVWRVVRRLGVREADVADVVQEVFLVVHRQLGGFEGRSSVRTWVYGIATRCASTHRRRAHLTREASGDVPESSIEPDQPTSIDRRQARARLDRLLDELSDDQRAVFVLYELEELPMAEIADVVGCPVQTAYSRLHAARKVISSAASAQGDDR
jgi:RNA polymerase sigma-70 factor (ECF subfamily)